MIDGARSAMRAARRSDLQRLAELRMRYLGEAAHLEQRLRLLPDARARTEQALPVWMGQDERILIVAEAEPLGLSAEDGPEAGLSEATTRADDGDADVDAEEANEAPRTEVVAYAMGVLNTAPPVLASQHVGEILELYVLPEYRGRGIARSLIALVTEALCGRGAQVLRSALPVANREGRKRLAGAGYVPLQRILERRLDKV